jgi:hypothetical protein
MHFRTRKNVVQLVRNTYDANTKKAVATVVARMPLAEPALTAEIRMLLTPKEAEEAQNWIEAQHRLNTLKGELAVLELADKFGLAAQWFEQNADSNAARNAAEQILRSWQRLRTVLKKKGLIE